MQKMVGTLMRDIACDYTLYISVDWRGYRLIEMHGTDAMDSRLHGTYETLTQAVNAANELLAEEEMVSGIEQERF